MLTEMNFSLELFSYVILEELHVIENWTIWSMPMHFSYYRVLQIKGFFVIWNAKYGRSISKPDEQRCKRYGAIFNSNDRNRVPVKRDTLRFIVHSLINPETVIKIAQHSSFQPESSVVYDYAPLNYLTINFPSSC